MLFLSIGCKRLISFVSRSRQLKRYFRMDTYVPHHLRSHPAHRNQHKTESATKDKEIKEVASRQIAEFEECHFVFTIKQGAGRERVRKPSLPPLLKLMVGVFSAPGPKLKGKHWHLLRMCPFRLESSQVCKFLSMWTV